MAVGVLVLCGATFARLAAWRSRLRDLGVYKIVVPAAPLVWDMAWVLFVVSAFALGPVDMPTQVGSQVTKLLIVVVLGGLAILAWICESRQRRALETHELSRGVLRNKIGAAAVKADLCKESWFGTKRLAVYVLPDDFRAWTATQRGYSVLLRWRFIESMSRAEIDAV